MTGWQMLVAAFALTALVLRDVVIRSKDEPEERIVFFAPLHKLRIWRSTLMLALLLYFVGAARVLQSLLWG